MGQPPKQSVVTTWTGKQELKIHRRQLLSRDQFHILNQCSSRGLDMESFWAFLRVCALNMCVPCIRVALYVCVQTTPIPRKWHCVLAHMCRIHNRGDT